MKHINFVKFLLFFSLILNSGCVKKSKYSTKKIETPNTAIPFEKSLLEKEKKLEKPIKKKLSDKKNAENGLDFLVENLTGRKIYVVCFSYIKKRLLSRWRWDKSPTYKLKNGEKVLVDIDNIPDKQERESIYGSLAIFNNKKDAETSIYELLNEKYRIDLDRIYKLKNKIVKIGIEKYGAQKELLDLDIEPIQDGKKLIPELDFLVENKTGTPLWLTCFVYQKKDDMPIWKHDKTNVLHLAPNETVKVDVDSISEEYNRVFMRGNLGVFSENEKKAAENSTFELLENKNSIPIGRLVTLRNKKIVLEIEKYGTMDNFIDFTEKNLN